MSVGSWTSSLTVLAVSDSLGTRKVSALNEPEAVLSVRTVTWAPAAAGSRTSVAAPRAAARAPRRSQLTRRARQSDSHESSPEVGVSTAAHMRGGRLMRPSDVGGREDAGMRGLTEVIQRLAGGPRGAATAYAGAVHTTI